MLITPEYENQNPLLEVFREASAVRAPQLDKTCRVPVELTDVGAVT